MSRRQSTALGWELVGICLAFFPPSSKCYSYLDGHIHKNVESYSHVSRVSHYSSISVSHSQNSKIKTVISLSST